MKSQFPINQLEIVNWRLMGIYWYLLEIGH